VTLVIEIALGIVLGAFLLWLIFAIANYQSPRPEPKWEPTVWLVCIGGLTKCIFAKDRPEGYCCGDTVYDPAFANTVHQFATYEEAKSWAKEMVNVSLGDTSEPERTYWHGNLEVRAVTPEVAARYMEYRIAGGKVDPVYLAECSERLRVANEKEAAEKAAHVVRMQERRDRANNPPAPGDKA
jgi:hypothetical protein